MTRLNREQLSAAVAMHLEASPDPAGQVDLVGAKGSVIVAAEVGEIKAAFKRIKKVDGYRWVAINRDDLFAANTASLGSKAGIIDGDGKVLKAPDIPRKKI